MYQYKFDDETIDQIKDSTKKSKSIFEQFKDVDDKYSTRFKESSIELEKLYYDKPSDVEIKKDAENSLNSYKIMELKILIQVMKIKNLI